jgi:hypothetical protein
MPELVQTVLDAGRECLTLRPEACLLVYDCAACGHLGSNTWIFRKLAMAIASLAGREADDREIREALERAREA